MNEKEYNKFVKLATTVKQLLSDIEHQLTAYQDFHKHENYTLSYHHGSNTLYAKCIDCGKEIKSDEEVKAVLTHMEGAILLPF